VVNSFEHLSNAQLEHYGTNNATESSGDAQMIEAHLEDCADCRARLLEHQRASLGLLSDAAIQAIRNPGSSSEVVVVTKSAVTKTSGPHGYASVAAGVCPSPSGPSEDDLRNLAAGLIAPDKALAVTEHAAQCQNCGSLLRAFTEDFSDELTLEETDALSQLNSSAPAWQKEIAGEAMKASSHGGSIRSVEAKPQGWRMRWMLVPAWVAACALIAFAIWYSQRETPEKVEKLLAQAYTEQRMTEYRIPDAEWGPVRVTRGAAQSHLSRPAVQLEAEKILAEHQSGDAGDPNWLTAKAEAEILDNNPEAAIADLTHAVAASPGSIKPEVLLAIAYAQKGDQLDDRTSWEKALEMLTRLINGKSEAERSVLLFNRAIVYERLAQPDKALADWMELTKSEDHGTWAGEGRKKIESHSPNRQ
jgi:tetratricopeptide (TPR) repeat protein